MDRFRASLSESMIPFYFYFQTWWLSCVLLMLTIVPLIGRFRWNGRLPGMFESACICLSSKRWRSWKAIVRAAAFHWEKDKIMGYHSTRLWMSKCERAMSLWRKGWWSSYEYVLSQKGKHQYDTKSPVHFLFQSGWLKIDRSKIRPAFAFTYHGF